ADTQIRYRIRHADRKVLPSSGPLNSGPSGAVDAPRRIGPDLQSGLRDGCAALDADPELAVVEPGHRVGDVLQPRTCLVEQSRGLGAFEGQGPAFPVMPVPALVALAGGRAPVDSLWRRWAAAQ